MKNFFKRLQKLTDERKISGHYRDLLLSFHEGYKQALNGRDPDGKFQESLFCTFLSLLKKECEHPFIFEPYHLGIKEPFNYYKFGLDFTRPLLYKDDSSIVGENHLKEICNQLQKGDNVILLANHQTELDPQIICCLLEDNYQELASNMIFVAGQKVITDLLAIPFSMGCNLLCIYSRRYIDHDPELKPQKQLHNLRTMKLMSSLLKEGGKCIYVAPSGGRDRPNQQGIVEVAPFDPDSIEMFRLMAIQAKTATHFYPLALSTYEVSPPPTTIEKGIGEKRSTKRSIVHICFGSECDMEPKTVDPSIGKHEKRGLLARSIWEQVNNDYQRIRIS